MSKSGVEDKAFICLHSLDNVFVCIKPVKAGDLVLVNGKEFELKKSIQVGHKLCVASIEEGDRVVKHGVTIGFAISKINPGDHVHNHNIKSGYIDSNIREENDFKGS